MEKLQNLLNEVIKKTDALKTAQTLYSRQLAPKFNTFDYINTNELGLSQIIADLLNPKGSHGQQEDFLLLFIKHCLPSVTKDSNWNPLLKNLEKTRIFIEEITSASNTQRRMDIYLECKFGDESYGICIENKPYASDQFEQLKDYAEELKQRGLTQWYLVYLNEHTDKPSEYSINSEDLEALLVENHFSSLKFRDLIDWLKACQIESQNHSVTEFLAQLVKFIQKQFMGIEDMNMENTVLEVMQKSEENIEASIQISNNVYEMKRQLVQKLIEDIKTEYLKKYSERPYQLDVSQIGEGKSYEQINFKIPKFDKGYISFEFQKSNFDTPCLGIKFHKIAGVKSYHHTEKIKTVLEENLKDKKIWKSPLWPAGYYFYPKNWRASSKSWLMIDRGEMAIKILEEMDTVFQFLNHNNCFEE